MEEDSLVSLTRTHKHPLVVLSHGKATEVMTAYAKPPEKLVGPTVVAELWIKLGLLVRSTDCLYRCSKVGFNSQNSYSQPQT